MAARREKGKKMETDEEFWRRYGTQRNLDLVEARARIEELEERLTEASAWTPLTDGEYEIPDNEIRVEVLGNELLLWKYYNSRSVSLPDDIRLCRRTDTKVSND